MRSSRSLNTVKLTIALLLDVLKVFHATLVVTTSELFSHNNLVHYGINKHKVVEVSYRGLCERRNSSGH